MMGGNGIRFGADIPKQYIKVNGTPVFLYTLEKYMETGIVDKVVIVSNPEWIHYTEDAVKTVLAGKLIEIVPGGETRSHSVKNGLACCSKYLEMDDLVLIHDATNPFVIKDAVARAIEAAEKNGAATVGTNQHHTLYKRTLDGSVEDFIPKETVGSGYSPEVFKFGVINPHFENASDERLSVMTSAVALAIKDGVKVSFIQADFIDLKITYPNDLKGFELLTNIYH